MSITRILWSHPMRRIRLPNAATLAIACLFLQAAAAQQMAPVAEVRNVPATLPTVEIA